MADLGSLTARIGLDTTGLAAGVAVARGELAALNTSGSNSLRALQTVGAAAFLGLAAAAGIVGTASVLAAADFESAMLRVRTQAGASQGEVDLMTEAILRMAAGLGTSPNALADALFRIESTGIRGAEALELLELAAMGAQVGAADLTEVTMGLLAIINSHIEGVGSQSEAMGILNGIVGISNVTMGELAHALGTGVLPAAAAAGVSIQELGAAFGVLTSTGLPAEVAANRLRTTIALMSAPTIDAQKAFEELGLGSFELAETLQRDGLIAAIELLKTSLENSGLTATEQADIIRRAFGGGEMSSTILTLLGNFDMLVAKEGELGAGAQNFQDSWEATKETFTFQMDQMKAAVEVLAIRLGTVLIPAVTATAEALADATTWLMEHKDVAVLLAGVIGGPLVAAMATFAATTLLAAAPVIAVGVAIGALTAGVIYAYQNFGPFRDAVDAVARFMRDDLVPALQDAARAVVDFAQDLVNVARPYVEDFVAFFQEIGPQIGEALTHALNVVKDYLTVVLAGIVLAWREWGDDIMQIVRNLFDTIAAIVDAALRIVANQIRFVLAVINGEWGDAWNAMKAVLDGFWDQIFAIVSGAGSHLANLFDAIWDTLYKGVEAGLRPLVGFFQGLGSEIWQGMQATWDPVLNFFRDLPTQIVGALLRLPGDLLALGQEALAGFIDGLETLLPFLFNWFRDLPGRITGAVGDATSWLKDVGIDAVQGFIDGLVEKGKDIGNWFAGLPILIKGFITDAITWLKGDGVDTIVGFLEGMADAAELVFVWVRDELPKKVKEGMATAAEWLKEHGPQIIEGLINGIETAMKNPATVLKIVAAIAGGLALVALAIPLVATAIGIAIIAGLIIGIVGEIPKIARMMLIDIPKGLGEVILSAGGWLVDAGVNLMGGLWHGAQVAWDLVLGWLKNLGSLIGGAFVGARTWLFNTGLDIIIGLLEGLTEAWNLIPGWVQNFLGPLKAGFEGLEFVIDRIKDARINITAEASGLDETTYALAMMADTLDRINEIPWWGGGPSQGFATGGIVPGPIGAPAMAVVHGGEQILTRSQQRAQDLVGAGSPMAATSSAAPTSQSSTTQYILQGDIVANDPAELERQLAARARLSKLTSAA